MIFFKSVFLALFFAMASVPKTTASNPEPKEPKRIESVPSSQQDRLLYYANKYTYVRESNGSNRSKEIDLWNKFCNVPMGSPYCASFVSYIHYLAKVDGPKTAWSPSCVSRNNVKFESVKGGDVFGLYFSSKRRVAHTGFVEKVSGSLVYCVEANTSPNAKSGSSTDRDGDGAHRKTRSKHLMSNKKNKFSRYWK